MSQMVRKFYAHYLVQGFINSYSQVFFTKSLNLSIILFLISFIDFNVGLAGVTAILFANVTAAVLGFDKLKTSAGAYGFNSLLVGLGIGVVFSFSFPVVILIFLASLLSLFIAIALEGMLYKYNLPYLSIPFIIVLLGINFASKNFANLGLNENWLFEYNELYKIGGISLIRINEYVNSTISSVGFRTYFHSLGAIFFQVNILAGIAISIGILLYSRIFFLLSLLGFYTAYYFYELMGADIHSLSYSYIGFNFILTAMAVGGFFTVPNLKSIVWTILILPLVALVSLAFQEVFAVFSAPIYAIPFNVIVLLFVYILKLRINKNIGPEFPVLQFHNPEKNLYYHRNFRKRFPNKSVIDLFLPFWGTWTVNQAFNGKYTHKDAWRYAWDFVMVDSDKKEFQNDGNVLEDYYCYNKPVIAAADGYITKAIDEVEDNELGKINIVKNWGNTVIINHGAGIYSQVSHLKKGSVAVVIGQYVSKGDILGYCGNSGRSPYPHVHFHVQLSPELGASSIKYPFTNYINTTSNQEFKSYAYPELEHSISNIEVSSILENALNLQPGKSIHFTSQDIDELITVEIDMFNNRYFTSSKYEAKAYFQNNPVQFYFSSFEGDKRSIIYTLYKALFRVQFGFYKNTKVYDEFAINTIYSKYKLALHDFIAPIRNVLSAHYILEYTSVDNESFPTEIGLSSSVFLCFLKRTFRHNKFEIQLNTNGISQISIQDKNNKLIDVKCVVE